MQAKLRCAKYMHATTMATKSSTTMVAPVAPLPTSLSEVLALAASNHQKVHKCVSLNIQLDMLFETIQNVHVQCRPDAT